MSGPYVHGIDPVIGAIGGVYLWWYGLSYTLGFLQIHLFLRRERVRLGLTPSQVYSLTLTFLAAVLLGGRAVEVAFDDGRCTVSISG
jgi:prolipoprotein diacylglyceryltransferase